jgi:hypothetical protein
MSTNERMQKLFAAAKLDGPSDESRAAMWTGIETAASISLGATGAAGGATGGTSALAAAKTALLASKLVLGLVFGASLTVGIAGALVAVTLTQSSARAPVQVLSTARTLEHVHEVNRAAPEEGDRAVNGGVDPNATPAVVITGRAATGDPALATAAHSPAHLAMGKPALSEQDRLAGEARMVGEARGALHRGDPDLALRIVRAARTQPNARMVPEELTVEAQALRAMGDEAGAKRVDADLASRFP